VLHDDMYSYDLIKLNSPEISLYISVEKKLPHSFIEEHICALVFMRRGSTSRSYLKVIERKEKEIKIEIEIEEKELEWSGVSFGAS
jgi:hypothetical protein